MNLADEKDKFADFENLSGVGLRYHVPAAVTRQKAGNIL